MKDTTDNWIEHYDPLLNDKEAAPVVGSTANSLRQSRYTGLLFGVQAPKFLKMGRSIRYRLSELLAFIDSFPEIESTTRLNDTQYRGSEARDHKSSTKDRCCDMQELGSSTQDLDSNTQDLGRDS